MAVKKRSYWFVSLLFCLLVVVGIFCWVGFAKSNSDFQWLIEPKFDSATDFVNGVAWVQGDRYGLSHLIDKQGNILVNNFQGQISPRDIDRETGLTPFWHEDGHYGYVNLSGDVVISPIYEWADPFQYGMAGVKKDDFYGVIDHQGETVLPYAYKSLYIQGSDMFVIKSDDKWGFINAEAEMVTDFIFDNVGKQSFPNTSLVYLGDKCGIIDKNGEWILPASYDYFYSILPAFSSEQGRDLVGIVKDGKVGFVDVNGNIAIDFQFKATESGVYNYYRFSEGLAPVLLPSEDKEKGSMPAIIDKTGKVLFELPGYPVTGAYREGYMMLRCPGDQRYGLIDRSGKWYSLPSNIGPEIVYGLVSDGVLMTNKGTRFNTFGKFGYIEVNKNGR